MRSHHFRILVFGCLYAALGATGPYGLAATDVLFLVDTTGSMSGLNNFKAVLDSLVAAIDANSLCPETILYGVADYRNYADGGNYQAYGVNLDLPFTSSIQDALSAINDLTANGGGDTPESQLKAMVSIADNWLTSSGDLGFNGRAEAQKILIWAGDAPGHIAGDEPGSSGSPPPGYYPTLDETIDALTYQSILVFALNSANCNAGLNTPYAGINNHTPPACQQASEITAATGGKLFCNVGPGVPDIEIDIIGAITCFSFSKDDGIDSSDCVIPYQEFTYEICWSNVSSQTVYDAFIIDRLPAGVDYPQGGYTAEFGDPNDPNQPLFTLIPPDPGYDKDTHTYVWPLGNISPNTNGCVDLDVMVNEKAVPGEILHNVADLYGTVYDPNSQTLVERLIARVSRDTHVCCYLGIVEELYVDPSAIGGNNTGLNWQNAFLDLQDALDYARDSICAQVHSIYVAQGTYSPGSSTSDSFVLPEGVSVYGGFQAGGSEFGLRNPKRYKTTLTGKINDIQRNNTVVTMGDETLLDGFTVTESNPIGYGIFGFGVDFTVNNCHIEKNEGYGLYAEDGNISLTWCIIRNNKADGIRHIGEGFTLTVENCWVRQSGRYGVVCENTTPTILNSIISESDMTNEGRAGVMMVNPTYQPYLQNVTVAHNKTRGIWRVGGALPEIYNSIVYHNGGPALAGFSADQAAWYSCIEDANSVNNNISSDPKFAYFDPNNVRIMLDSPCHDSGLTLQENYSQVDMDNRSRVLGYAVDRGAYEIECEDTSNYFDLNADGLVNFHEFSGFSKAWRGHDPNDPVWLADPNLADPNLSDGWYEWKYKYNFDPTGNSKYSIDLADLTVLLNAPWLWKACWLDLEEVFMQQMISGDDEMLRMRGKEEWQMFSSMETTPEPSAVEGKSVQEQIVDLATAIVFLEQIWIEDPEIQKQIDPDVWQQFMEAVYGHLLELKSQYDRIE
ncbi:MAG TPA: right-handed parallel beta-helix repeat-containing protein [Anaerohalosphaeraceae bacterium]|nr:right-handed parallel beta-helix repeat-containing protein [Anaerohalosphaeraceae bacterium]